MTTTPRGLGPLFAPAVLAAAALLFSVAPAPAVTITAGDIDGASPAGEPEDDATPRPAFATWLAFEANNNDLHSNQPREFDTPGSNHTFGHTFTVPVGEIDLTAPVTLTASFTQVGGNDSMGFQAFDGPESLFDRQNDAFPFPRMSTGLGAGSFLTLGSGGATVTSAPISFDLRNFTAGAGPLAGQNIAATVNDLGYLDVFVADDTIVDYLQLSYTPVPEPGAAVLLTAAACGLAAPRRR